MNKKEINVVLCILDGWGMNPSVAHNGIACARTPCWNEMVQTYPIAQLQASELYVGLPHGQMGNSEVGHMTIGSGRVVMQDLPRIDLAVERGEITSLSAFQGFAEQVMQGTKVVHLMGLMSPGGVHSHQGHLVCFAKLLADLGVDVWVHAFLDGRDTPPESAAEFFVDFLQAIQGYPRIRIATFEGRYFAMDRDKRWDRIEKAYQAMVLAVGVKSDNVLADIQHSYAEGIGDEFILPHVCTEYPGMQDGDALLMINFRADRVRQLLTALLDSDFKEFDRSRTVSFAATLGMTPYSEKLTPLIPALFEKQSITKTLGEVISQAGLKQLRVAETEKYAHVTFFFNGGREQVFAGEDRRLIPSPQVATYDLKPEMSAHEMTDYLVKSIQDQAYQLIVVNYANPDMVGHTGVQEAIIKAVETVDHCLQRLLDACKETGTVLIITADHGNVEQMVDEVTGGVHTAHTLNPVPFVVANAPGKIVVKEGALQNIAPTVLEIMGLDKPAEMTGESLICSQVS